MPDPAPPLLITVAPNGARRTHADHAALPLTPAALAETALACRDAGAAMIHLHVRDAQGRHSLDVDLYAEAIAAIRTAVGPDLVIQATTEAVGRYDRHAQMQMVQRLRPEAVSLAVRELIPDAAAEADAAAFLRWTVEAGLFVQYIVYDPAELARLRSLHTRGVIPEKRPFVLYVLGRYGVPDSGAPRHLVPFLAQTDKAGTQGDDASAAEAWTEETWAVCAFGRRESASTLAAAALGGHIRVGFENNLHLAEGALAPDNAALVRQAVTGAAAIGRRPMHAEEARARFRLWRDGTHAG